MLITLLLVVAASARNWQSGDNGLVQWSSKCFFHAREHEVIESKPSLGSQCGGICIANPRCNHVSFNGSTGICYLISSAARTPSDFNGGVCGFVSSRAW